jgi:putative ABC transport system permease protein
MLGFLIGTAIAARPILQLHPREPALLRHPEGMGTSNAVLLRMIVLQALVVGALGYGSGWAPRLFGYVMRARSSPSGSSPRSSFLRGAIAVIVTSRPC